MIPKSGADDEPSQVLEKLLYLGINHFTVYLLSIENLKRPKEDIDHLWKLGEDNFRLLCSEE